MLPWIIFLLLEQMCEELLSSFFSTVNALTLGDCYEIAEIIAVIYMIVIDLIKLLGKKHKHKKKRSDE